MIPTIAQAASSESARLDFNEPLDEIDRRTIEALTELYVGKEAPLMTFSRDGKTTLVIPKSISKIFPVPQRTAVVQGAGSPIQPIEATR